MAILFAARARFIWLRVLVCIQLSSAALMGQAIPVAVLDFDGVGISQSEAVALSNRLRNELFKLGVFDVVDRGMMETIMAEQDFQTTGCTSNDCLVEVGRLIGAQQMIGGSVSKVGGTYSVSCRLVDVETGKLLGVSDYDLSGKLDDMLIKGMRIVALKLSGKNEEAQALITQQQPVFPQVPIQTAPTPPAQPQPQTSSIPIGAGHAKTMGALGGKTNTFSFDFALDIDFRNPSSSTGGIQYGMILGFVFTSYDAYPDAWPTDNDLINDLIDENSVFLTDAGNLVTVFDLDELFIYGGVVYGMAMVSRPFGWHEGMYGTKLFAGAGFSSGTAQLEWYTRGGDGSENYDISGLIYTAGAQLRVGHPRFSLVFSAKLLGEPIGGPKPYLSVGILWPF